VPLQTSKAREKVEKKSYVCSNPSCQKAFKKPLVIKLYACPFCLSKIETPIERKSPLEEPKEQNELRSESEPLKEEKKQAEAVELEATPAIQEETLDNKPACGTKEDSTCKYYFGYLSQREKGKPIPDECMQCSQCMDCILSELYKSKKSVSEIKKWYQFSK
jgi:DNA-directed RNA polymerase subunit RPC12/RpoP